MGADSTKSPDLSSSDLSSSVADLPTCQSPQCAGPVHLRREVLYPQRQNTGVGVMLVASAAMFFAVASSAFILRAQMPQRSGCVHASETQATPMRAVPVELIGDELNAGTIETCGEPYYEENTDGTVSVFFDLCSPTK